MMAVTDIRKELIGDQPQKRAKVLFMDDRSKRIHAAIEKYADADLTIVTNVIECLRFLSNEDWDLVLLDHDLGGKEFVDPDDTTCGMQVIRYLEKTAWPPEKRKPIFLIHSSNVFAACAMQNRLQENGYRVERERFVYD